MIDPIIFSIKLFGLTLTLRWYGVLVMLGALVGTWIAEKEVNRRDENGERVWDLMVWVLPAGIVGARLWYVLNTTLGGSRYYLDDPLKIINIPEGGLHFFGGLVFGAIALLLYLNRNKLDVWLFLDAIAPAVLIGQAVARPANFINQELYGPPTQLPWGISIDAAHRLAQYSDLGRYPVDTAQFHPTFAYEMIWNFLTALFLIWYSRQFPKRMKPGVVFGGWLVLAGFGRFIIEFFRPDQPLIPGTAISYSSFVAILMAIAGTLLLLIRYGKFKIAQADGWEEQYKISKLSSELRTKTDSASNKKSLETRRKSALNPPAHKGASKK